MMGWSLDTVIPKDMVAIATIPDWVVFYSKTKGQIYFYSTIRPVMLGLSKEELLEFAMVIGEKEVLH